MPAQTQTREILIKVDTRGNRELKDIADGLGGITKSVDKMSGSLDSLKRLIPGGFGVYFGFQGIQQIAALSDELQGLNNRIAILAGSQEKAADVMAKLAAVADNTNSSISSVAETYSRLGSSLKETGISQDILIDLTRVLQNSFRVAGATITETTATIIQLSQSFSSGQVRGQELRSVMEQNVVVAGLLRKEYGKDIYKKAADGAISAANILRILYKNQDLINSQAKVLAPTIGQTLTKAMNQLQLSVFKINQQFDLSNQFAKGMQFLIDHLPELSEIIGILAITRLPALALSIESVSIGLYAASLSNPFTASVLLVSSTAVLALNNLDALKAGIQEIGAVAVDSTAEFADMGAAIARAFFLRNLGGDKLSDTANELRDYAHDLRQASDVARNSNIVPYQDQASKKAFDDFVKRQEALYNNLKEKKIKEELAAINKEYLKGAMSVSQYNEKLDEFNLYKLNRQFKEGKFDIDTYNKGMEKLIRQGITREFQRSTISLEEFNQRISSSKIRDLETELHAGKISLQEFNVELAKVSYAFSPGGALRAGTQGYLDSLGTTTQQVASAITSAFTALETSFGTFIKTGKFEFSKFAQSILDDLQKIIIRASIVQPLANAILTSFGGASGSAVSTNGYAGGSYGTNAPLNANGNVYDRGLKKFAKGGVVNSATAFGYGSGKMGIMGEAGPEAILPLSRGSGGKLGVEATVTPVNINIFNNSSSTEVQTQETTGPSGERMIEVMIVNKVKEGIAKGSFDRSMQQSYGLNRKGS